MAYYKIISGRYKICGKNGNCKEFNLISNNLIFEGEYLNEQKMKMEKNIMMMVNN